MVRRSERANASVRRHGKCVAVAHSLISPVEKLALIDMAQAWIELAKQAEKNERVLLVCETPEADKI